MTASAGQMCIRDRTGAVDILMDGDHAPSGVGSRGDGLLDGLLVLGHIVIVGVEHDKPVSYTHLDVYKRQLTITAHPAANPATAPASVRFFR